MLKRRRTVLLIVTMLFGLTLIPGSIASGDGGTLFVAVGGRGDCSLGKPCGDVETAFGRANAGDVIELAAGAYPLQAVQSNVVRAAGFAQNVVVRAAAGARVSVHGIDIDVPHLTVRGLHATDDIRLRPNARFSRYESMDVEGASALITGADDAALIGSRIRPSDNADGLQVKALDGDSPLRTRIEGNVVGPGRLTNGLAHVDCIQFLGGDDVVVTRNILFDCANTGIQIGNYEGGKTGRLTIERNFIRECTPRTAVCNGYHAVTIGSANANAVRFMQNTVVGNVAVAGDLGYASFTAVGNIATSLPCGPSVSDNLIADGCPGANLRGTVGFRDPLAPVPDLHLLTGSPAIDRSASSAPWPDIDGQPACGSTDLGADEFCFSTPPSTIASSTTTSRASTTTTRASTTTTSVTTAPSTTGPTTTRPVASTTTLHPPDTTAPDVETFQLALNSRRPSRTVSFTVDGGPVLIAVWHRPYAGVAKSNLRVVLYSPSGAVLQTQNGTTDVYIFTTLPAGGYKLKVSGRPGVVTAKVYQP